MEFYTLMKDGKYVSVFSLVGEIQFNDVPTLTKESDIVKYGKQLAKGLSQMGHPKNKVLKAAFNIRFCELKKVKIVV